MGKDHQNLSGEGLILIGKKIDQENVGKQTEEWSRWSQVFFPARGMLVLCARRFVLEMIKVMDIRNIWFFYFLRC